MDYEICRENLERLANYFTANQTDRNEATTRLQLIDCLLFECLGWERDECLCEDRYNREYADYTFTRQRRVLIIEAKREGDYFDLPLGIQKREYLIKTLSHDYPSLDKAIKQAMGYCQSRGVSLGAVCNGHQIVTFLANRVDGVPPLDGRAIVFPTYDEMLREFRLLWDSLSKEGVQEGYLRGRLSQTQESPLPPKLAAKILGYPGQKHRNTFQTDLNILSDFVLEDLSKSQALEDSFLQECYCHSGALSQYALISRNILRSRYEALFDEQTAGPTLVAAVAKTGLSPDLVAEGLSRRPILLIGDVGVGKTTFIRHLIKVQAAEIFQNAITFYIDLGSQAALSSNLRHFILEELETQLRVNENVDVEEGSFVRNVYHHDLERFRHGIFGALEQLDPQRFELKQLEFLEEKIQDRDRHLHASLKYLEKYRRRQVVVFIDNADQRNDETQQEAFLIAQEMADSWPVTVFVALRPETFHKSKRGGTLSGYHAKAFSISPPRIDLVIDKRLSFGIKIASGQIPIPSLAQSTGGKLRSLEAILRVFQNSLHERNELYEAIDNIAGGNVRLALDFVQEFFGSGHVDTEKIVNIYTETGSYHVALHEFLRAITFGDSKHYDSVRSPIANMFDLTTNDPKEHFLLSILLGVVMSHSGHTHDVGFIETNTVYDILQNYAYSVKQIDSAIIRCYSKQLLVTSGRQIPEPALGLPQALRITTVGAYHLQKLIGEFTYIDAIIVDTPILIREYREKTRDIEHVADRLERAEIFRLYLDDQWSQSSVTSEVFDWRVVSRRLKDNIEYVRAQAIRRGYISTGRKARDE